MKPFLILQLRVIDEAADQEFEAIMKYGGLERNEVVRIRMEKESFDSINACDFAGIIVGGGPSNVSDDIDKKNLCFKFGLKMNYTSYMKPL